MFTYNIRDCIACIVAMKLGSTVSFIIITIAMSGECFTRGHVIKRLAFLFSMEQLCTPFLLEFFQFSNLRSICTQTNKVISKYLITLWSISLEVHSDALKLQGNVCSRHLNSVITVKLFITVYIKKTSNINA